MTEIINKLTVFFFILSTLNILRHSYYLIIKMFLNDGVKYKLSKESLFFLGLSVAYSVTIMTTGIKTL